MEEGQKFWLAPSVLLFGANELWVFVPFSPVPNPIPHLAPRQTSATVIPQPFSPPGHCFRGEDGRSYDTVH